MMEGSQIPTGATALLPSHFTFLSVCPNPNSALLGNTSGDPPWESNAQELSIVALLSTGASFSGLLPCALGMWTAVQLELSMPSRKAWGNLLTRSICKQSFCFPAHNPEVQMRRVASTGCPASDPGPPALSIAVFCCSTVPLESQSSCQLLHSSGLQVSSGH